MISEGKQIKIGAILSYCGIFLGIISGLVYHPWMIHMIGDADYGLYTLAMSLINIFLVDFGLGMASQRYISKYRAENEQQKVNDVVGLIHRLYLTITVALLIIFVGLYFFLDSIYTQLTPAESEKFKVLYVMVSIYSVTTFPFVTLSGILGSYEKFIQLKASNLLYKVISVLLTAMALVAGRGVYALVVVNLIASVGVTALRFWFVRRCTPVRANFSYFERDKAKELLHFSVWATVPSITTRLLLAVGPTILGMVYNSFEIAVFGYAVSMEGHIYSFVNAINGFFMPRLAKISANSTKSEGSAHVLQLMISVGRFILILYGLIFVGFVATGREFIALLVGPDYLRAYVCVLLICGYGIVAYPQQVANTYVVVQNKVKQRALISLFSFGLYGSLAFVFGRAWGAVGVSMAICVSLVTQTVLMNILYQKVLGIDVMAFFKQCHLRLLPGFLIFAAAAAVIALIPLAGWIGFGLKVVLITAVYSVIIWRFFLEQEERKSVASVILRKFGGGR